eukprot:COSAG03_NODE_1906_length_3370_cov_36.493514_1_plen_73_part_00
MRVTADTPPCWASECGHSRTSRTSCVAQLRDSQSPLIESILMRLMDMCVCVCVCVCACVCVCVCVCLVRAEW